LLAPFFVRTWRAAIAFWAKNPLGGDALCVAVGVDVTRSEIYAHFKYFSLAFSRGFGRGLAEKGKGRVDGMCAFLGVPAKAVGFRNMGRFALFSISREKDFCKCLDVGNE